MTKKQLEFNKSLILIKIPTIAIEKVHVYNNTSVIQDEVLAHRLGLIPLKCDPRLFKYKTNRKFFNVLLIREKTCSKTHAFTYLADTDGNEDDTLQFELKIKCKKNPNTINEKDVYIDSKGLPDSYRFSLTNHKYY